MTVELIKSFKFDAAHSLHHLPETHKCSNFHGHSYKVDIHISGPVDPKIGWLMDFGDLKKIVAPVIDSLDHKNLDQIEDLPISTSEILAKYIWDKIAPSLPFLSAVTIWESDSSRCIYRGN